MTVLLPFTFTLCAAQKVIFIFFRFSVDFSIKIRSDK